MKKLLIFLISIQLIFSSCEKDDANNSSSILGTWKSGDVTRVSTEGYIDPVLGTEVITNVDINTAQSDQQYFTFRSDNIYLGYIYYNDTILGVDTLNYIKNGNEIILQSEIILTITDLTNTNLSCNFLNPGNQWTSMDTNYFLRLTGELNASKSNLPS